MGRRPTKAQNLASVVHQPSGKKYDTGLPVSMRSYFGGSTKARREEVSHVEGAQGEKGCADKAPTSVVDGQLA